MEESNHYKVHNVFRFSNLWWIMSYYGHLHQWKFLKWLWKETHSVWEQNLNAFIECANWNNLKFKVIFDTRFHMKIKIQDYNLYSIYLKDSSLFTTNNLWQLINNLNDHYCIILYQSNDLYEYRLLSCKKEEMPSFIYLSKCLNWKKEIIKIDSLYVQRHRNFMIEALQNNTVLLQRTGDWITIYTVVSTILDLESNPECFKNHIFKDICINKSKILKCGWKSKVIWFDSESLQDNTKCYLLTNLKTQWKNWLTADYWQYGICSLIDFEDKLNKSKPLKYIKHFKYVSASKSQKYSYKLKDKKWAFVFRGKWYIFEFDWANEIKGEFYQNKEENSWFIAIKIAHLELNYMELQLNKNFQISNYELFETLKNLTKDNEDLYLIAWKSLLSMQIEYSCLFKKLETSSILLFNIDFTKNHKQTKLIEKLKLLPKENKYDFLLSIYNIDILYNREFLRLLSGLKDSRILSRNFTLKLLKADITEESDILSLKFKVVWDFSYHEEIINLSQIYYYL